MNLGGPHLELRHGELRIGGFAAEDLAAAYGTPLYVTDVDRILTRYDEALEAISRFHKHSSLAYAFKANSCRAVVEALARRGAGAAVVSLDGLRLALECGVDREKVVFDGPSKSRAELKTAVTGSVGMINAESVQEVLDIESVCEENGVASVSVGIRVNFGLRADTHSGLVTGARGGKFGIPVDEATRFLKSGARKLKRVRIRGLHSHVGSQITDSGIFRRLALRMLEFAEKAQEDGRMEIEEFNFGGGLGVDYGSGNTCSFREYAESTAGCFEKARGEGAERVRLVFELGRSLVADSTVLLSRVNYVKKSGKTQWALLDAGMNDFLRPALYGAYHRIVPARTESRTRSSAAYSFGGPVCESTDAFGTDRKLGVRLTQGDLVGILDAGAYGISMASNYNMRPLPAVAVISQGEHRLADTGEARHDRTGL